MPKRKAPAQITKKIPKRAKNHRTRQTPFETADDVVYTARKISAESYNKERGGWCYHTFWEGYDDADATWEPLQNLMDCGPHLRDFKKQQELENKACKDREEGAGLRLHDEIEMYLGLPDVPMGTDPLKWWPQHEALFPNLSRMARQYPGCPATSASAERVFSLAGRLYNDYAQNLTEQNLEDRMWAKVNRVN